MKNFNKIIGLSFLTFTIVLAPSVTFAAWWNPLTWGHSAPQNKAQTVSKVISTSTTPVKQVKTAGGLFDDLIPKNQPSVKKNPSVSGTLKALANAQIISKVKPAVVYIETKKASGSGMIIETSGSFSLILTNAHVVKGYDMASITLSNGGTYSGAVLGRDEINDLAIVTVNAGNLPAVSLGDSDTLKQGDNVYALGYPFGLKGDAVFTAGLVSRASINTDDGNLIQTSIEIHPGNSGGPLINQYGQVVGINAASYTDSTVRGVQLGETIKFAVPINLAKSELGSLKKGQNTISKTPAAPDIAAIQKQCQKQADDASKEYLNNVSGTTADDPETAYLLNEIQSEEDSAKAQHDSTVSEIRSEFDSQISSAQASYSNMQTVQQTSNFRTGISQYTPEQANGTMSSIQQQGQSAVSLMQNQENMMISQADSTYQAAYSRYEAQRQKILAGVASAKKAADASAKSIKDKTYQDCINQ